MDLNSVTWKRGAVVCTSLGICCQHKAAFWSQTSKPEEPLSWSTCYSEDVWQLIHSLALSNHLGRVALEKCSCLSECLDLIVCRHLPWYGCAVWMSPPPSQQRIDGQNVGNLCSVLQTRRDIVSVKRWCVGEHLEQDLWAEPTEGTTFTECVYDELNNVFFRRIMQWLCIPVI